MTIIKVSRSGRQFQVVDDFGRVYGISVLSVRNLLDGKVVKGFSLLNRLPFDVSPDRFQVSPIWDPCSNSLVTSSQGSVSSVSSDVNLSNDALSANTLKSKEVVKNVSDKVVW